MGLVLDWKKKLGYKRDPFEQTVMRPAERYIVGFSDEQEQFNLFLIKEGRIGTLTGPEGTGKTTFLTWALDALSESKYRAAYLDAKKAPKQVQLIDTLLSNTTSRLTRKRTLKKPAGEKYKLLLKKLSKRPYVLLVDNADSLSKEGYDLFDDLVDKTPTNVIFADEKLKVKGAKLELETPDYSEEDLKLLLQKRIEAAGSVGLFPFNEEECGKLIKKSKKNPAKLLGLARERAIELSLKVKQAPKPAKKQKSDVKRFGFLNIHIDRGDEELPEIEPRAPESRRDDEAEMLREIVAEERVIEEEKEEKSRGDIDKDIEEVAKSLGSGTKKKK